MHEDGYANSSCNKASNNNPVIHGLTPILVQISLSSSDSVQGRQHLAIISGSHKDHIRVIFDEAPCKGQHHHPCPKSNKGNFYRWYDRHQGNQECHHKQRKQHLGPPKGCLAIFFDMEGNQKADREKYNR